MLLQEESFELFADYFQFYLQDESAEPYGGDAWTDEAFDRHLAIAPGAIVVGTVRNMMVPVSIEVHSSKPETDANSWDHIVECSIQVDSGKIVVAGCTDYFPDARRIGLDPGCYRARVLYGALDSVDGTGLEGDDRYCLQLWKAPHRDLAIVKKHSIEPGA